MSLYQPEPVEVSTRMRPGEWSEASLQEHIEAYQSQIRDMGAAEEEIVTEVVRNDDGSVEVVVTWAKTPDAGS